MDRVKCEAWHDGCQCRSACPARERSGQTLFAKGSVFEKIALHHKSIMYFSRVSVKAVCIPVLLPTDQIAGVSLDQQHGCSFFSIAFPSNWCPQVSFPFQHSHHHSAFFASIQFHIHQISHRSQYPEKPIENPADWAWGQHPR